MVGPANLISSPSSGLGGFIQLAVQELVSRGQAADPRSATLALWKLLDGLDLEAPASALRACWEHGYPRVSESGGGTPFFRMELVGECRGVVDGRVTVSESLGRLGAAAVLLEGKRLAADPEGVLLLEPLHRGMEAMAGSSSVGDWLDSRDDRFWFDLPARLGVETANHDWPERLAEVRPSETVTSVFRFLGPVHRRWGVPERTLLTSIERQRIERAFESFDLPLQPSPFTLDWLTRPDSPGIGLSRWQWQEPRRRARFFYVAPGARLELSFHTGKVTHFYVVPLLGDLKYFGEAKGQGFAHHWPTGGTDHLVFELKDTAQPAIFFVGLELTQEARFPAVPSPIHRPW